MLHQTSPTIVYMSRQYSSFNFINGNRMLDEAKIKRIISDIKSGNNLLPVCPIIVDPDMNIIDGQHRFYVAQKTKNTVYYVIHDFTTIQQIAKMNSRQKGWKTIDYLQCYIHTANENYMLLDKFMDANNLTISGACMLLSQSKYSADNFKDGKFQIKSLSEAQVIADKLNIFSSSLYYRQTNFIRAIMKLHAADKVDWHQMYEQWIASGENLKECNSDKLYIVELEIIYNFRKQKRTYII